MIEVKNIVKSFKNPDITVLYPMSFEIEKGEFVAVTGHSGSGKSTLLYVISGLDTLTQGSVYLAGQDISKMDSKTMHIFRNKRIGFVFQFHYLLPELTCFENILMPSKKFKLEKEKKEAAMNLMEEFDIISCRNKYPSQISGGQQQRVAIARSLVMNPSILFADEPTGNLDSINGEKVMKIFNKINKNFQTTIVMVTHEKEYAKMAKRQIHLVDGKIISDERNEKGVKLIV